MVLEIRYFPFGAKPFTMEEKSQLWFACSPFIQVSFGSSKEKEGKRRGKRQEIKVWKV